MPTAWGLPISVCAAPPWTTYSSRSPATALKKAKSRRNPKALNQPGADVEEVGDERTCDPSQATSSRLDVPRRCDYRPRHDRRLVPRARGPVLPTDPAGDL